MRKRDEPLFIVTRHALYPLALVLAGSAVYLNTFSCPFFFDDLPSIPENRYIRHLWPIWEAFRSPPRVATAGRPITSFSFALNYAVGGLNVWSWHLANLLIHLAAGLTLFGLLKRTLQLPLFAGRFASAGDRLAFAISLLWLVHPLQTDSITFVSNRTECMMGLFYLLTLYCFLRGATVEEGPPRRWLVGSFISCGLGMGTKEVMVSAPFMTLLFDWIFVSGTVRQALRARWRFYSALAGTWGILLVFLAATIGPRTNAVGFHFDQITPLDYLRTQCSVVAHYLRLVFWPDPLIVDYYGWPIAKTWREVLPAAALMLSLSALTFWSWRRWRWLSFLGAWFFFILAPSSSFLPIITEVATERRMYLPLISVLVPAVLLVHGGLERIFSALRPGEAARGAVRRALLAAAACGLGLVAFARNADYRSNQTIWEDTVRKFPGNARALANLGNVYLQQGRISEATSRFVEALRVAPVYSAELVKLGPIFAEVGVNLARKGDPRTAAHLLQNALRLCPRDVQIRTNLGVALGLAGQTDDAIASLQEALKIDPESTEAHYNLATIDLQRGRLDEAIERYERVLRADPEHRESKLNLEVARKMKSK